MLHDNHKNPKCSNVKSIVDKGIKLYKKSKYVEAFDFFWEASALGNGKAMWYLGQMYEKGLGVDCNNREAEYWYDKALINGNINPETTLNSSNFIAPDVLDNHSYKEKSTQRLPNKTNKRDNSLLFKYRVFQLAKDCELRSEQIMNILEAYMKRPKDHMQVLTTEELDIVFAYLINQLENSDEVDKFFAVE